MPTRISNPLPLVNSAFFKPLRATVLLFALFAVTSAFATTAPEIVRQPYRILYCGLGTYQGEFPPLDMVPPRVDASSLVNLGCVIDLRIVASGTGLTYQWKKGTANIPGANSSQLYIPVSSLNDAGVYRCEVTNAFGSVLSMPVRMAVLNVQASDHFVAAAPTAAVNFTAAYKFPTTTGGFKFRWYRMLGSSPDSNTDEMLADGGAYTGATKALLRVKVADATVAGSYYCVVTAYNTYMRTGLRHLAVVPTPLPTMVQLGEPMQFSVSPTGPAHLLNDLSYSWLKQGNALPDSDASTYVVAAASADDAGLYSVRVTQPLAGTVTTPQVAGLVITPTPGPVLAIQGGTAYLSAPPPPHSSQTYRWYRDGVPLNESAKYVGVAKGRLMIRALQAGDAGDYECRGTLYGDTVVVARPVLIVVPTPPSQVAVLGEGLQLEVSPQYGGSAQVTPELFGYQWVKGSGATAVVLPDGDGPQWAVANASLSDVASYTVQVSYPGASTVKSGLVRVAVVNTTPKVFNVNAGKAVSLTPTYQGAGTTFQWRRNGVPLVESLHHVGVNRVSMRINGATLADAGSDYECVVGYPGGSSVAAPVQVVVYSAPEIVGFELPDMIIGKSANYAITCSPDPLYAPQAYDARVVLPNGSLAALPSGLVVNRLTGVISGVPSVSGTFTLRALVRNAVGTTTADSQLVIHALPTHLVGRYNGSLPRMPAGEFGAHGGRFDMAVNANASLSGALTVGGSRFAFRGVLNVSDTNPSVATASANITVPRTGGNLTLSFELGLDSYLSEGLITGAGNTMAFNAWRSVHSMASPPTQLAGQYHLGLMQMPAPPVPAVESPQGYGYASFSLSETPTSDVMAGNYSMVVRLADDSTFTTTANVGPRGELLVYGYLYGTWGGGGVVGSGFSVAIDPDQPGKTIEGDLTWTRPASSSRRYRDGFGPLALTAFGGRYVPGDRLLSAEEGQLTFADGGLHLASRDPNASFAIGLGNTPPVRTTANEALTTVKALDLATGMFSGTFLLADDNPTTATVNALEYRRTVSFKGLVVPREGELVGVGFFIMPQIPTLDPLTTTTTSPELSGNLLFEPVVD